VLDVFVVVSKLRRGSMGMWRRIRMRSRRRSRRIIMISRRSMLISRRRSWKSTVNLNIEHLKML